MTALVEYILNDSSCRTYT